MTGVKSQQPLFQVRKRTIAGAGRPHRRLFPSVRLQSGLGQRDVAAWLNVYRLVSSTTHMSDLLTAFPSTSHPSRRAAATVFFAAPSASAQDDTAPQISADIFGFSFFVFNCRLEANYPSNVEQSATAQRWFRSRGGCLFSGCTALRFKRLWVAKVGFGDENAGTTWSPTQDVRLP